MAAVSSRYARAFADVIADKRLDAEGTLGELAQMVELVSSSAELRTVLESPAIPAEQKRRLLDAVVQRGGFSTQVRNFLAVIVDHRRVALLGEIVQQLRTELNQRLGIADAEVTSARELGEDERRALESRLAASTGRKVRAHYKIDSAVLGGAVVRIGSTIYDGSVRGQLRKLKEALSS
jgi:F-type H+-transporting ATPase subunit delta